MNSYAADTLVFLSGAPLDNAALREAFKRFLADPALKLTFWSDPPVVAGSGELAVAQGAYKFTHTDAAGKIMTNTGRHLIAWRLDKDGAWRIIRQMTIEDPRPPAATP